MNKLIRFILSVVICVILLKLSATAAEIYESTIEGCDLHLSGNIEKGDAQKLKDAVRNWDGWSTDGTTLCLNSPGGSLIEGKRLFDTIWDGNFETRVRDQEQCLSACAIAFLGGTKNLGTGNIRFLTRSIDPGATLGFHAPSLAIEKGSMIASEAVSRSFEVALKAAEQFFEIKLLEQHSVKVMNDYLYHQILRTRPESMYNIETIGDAVLSGIRLRNLQYPKNLDAKIFKNICDSHWVANATAIYIGFSNFKEYYDLIDENFQDFASERIPDSERIKVIRRGDETIGIVKGYFGDSGYSNLRQTSACIVRLGDGWQDDLKYIEEVDVIDGDGIDIRIIGFSLWGDDIPSDREILDRAQSESENFTVPYWYLFDPEMKIKDQTIKSTSAASNTVERSENLAKNLNKNTDQSFIKFSGRDFLGSDLANGIIRQTDVENCLSVCKNNSSCQAITFDRWNDICFLKSVNRRSSNLLFNSKADSYIIANRAGDASDISENFSEVKTITRKGKGFVSRPDESFTASSLDQCEQMIKSKRALAFNWRPKTKKCEVFFSPVEYFNLDNSIVGYFHQDIPN
ncbi:MAG: hypothetical protein JJ858_19030 [Rhizobiaceae bacterium]|nr:hypothetical protein [Rhizobiaceae bacterium]